MVTEIAPELGMSRAAIEAENRIIEEDRKRWLQEKAIKAGVEQALACQAQQYTEAPVSLNITCYLNGFKLGFTVRNGSPSELAKKIPGIVSYLERIGATPTPGAAAQAEPAVDPAECKKETPVCECGTPGVFAAGENERGPWSGYKCPRCDEFIKGTFRRGKTYASERVPLGGK